MLHLFVIFLSVDLSNIIFNTVAVRKFHSKNSLDIFLIATPAA